MPALRLVILLGLLTACGCAEITRPTPTAQEVAAAQISVLTRQPYATYTEERAMRVFLRLLPTLPRVHGRTYPFLGFNWWVTEDKRPVVDNVWYPSPAADAPRQADLTVIRDPYLSASSTPPEPALRQGDVILAVNGIMLPLWVPEWDMLCRWLRESGKYSFTGEVLVDLVLTARYLREEAAGIYYRGGPVTLTIERQGVQQQVTIYPLYLPAPYSLLVLGGRVGNEVNAYAAPGVVMVTRRFVSLCRTDDELALILGHELAHHANGHLARRAGQYAATGFVGEVVGLLLRLFPRPWGRPYPPVDKDLRQLISQATFSVYSRQDEREADAYGLWYAYQAGYDVDQALDLWGRIAAVVHRDPLESTYYLDSHPAPPERLARLKKIATLFKAGRAAEVFVPEMLK